MSNKALKFDHIHIIAQDPKATARPKFPGYEHET